MTEPDPYEPVVVKSWAITREDIDGQAKWLLTTEAVTLHGREFTARKHYDDIEGLLGFIREVAT